MKKKITFIALILLLCFALFWYKYIYGWMEFHRNNDTPKEFLSEVIIHKKSYIKDSIDISKQLRNLLLKHKDFFYSEDYFNGTTLKVDSILYSSDFNKLAILVITKNPTSRQLIPAHEHDWYYDATCYLGVRLKDSIALSWIGPNFTNATDEQNISKDLREACFRTFALPKNKGGFYAYNMNDKRFWNSPIWRKIKEDEVKDKLFEKEKREHPENISEP